MGSRFLNSAVSISPDLIELAPDGLQISELYGDLELRVPHPVVQICQCLLLLLRKE
jgi:hypothetical protein